MRAVIYHRYGSPDVVEYVETDQPTPLTGEVLIKVSAASVNPYDWHFLRGMPIFIRLFTGVRRPKSTRLGADAAGMIIAIGPGVTRFKPGDVVFGSCKRAFAEFERARETNLAVKPKALSYEEATSRPIAGITALQGLRDCGNECRNDFVDENTFWRIGCTGNLRARQTDHDAALRRSSGGKG